MNTITLSPRNSIIFVYGHSNQSIEVPTYMAGKLVAANPTCVSIGTLSEIDGETTITLSDKEGIETGKMVFVGVLQTPQKELSVCNADNEKLLTIPVAGTSTKVKIFANDPSEPDEIVVLAEPA